jgi:hypothetical protein
LIRPSTRVADRGWCVPCVGAVAWLLSASPVRGQTAEAVAETLYQEGKQLIEHGQYAEACPKLAESHRMDPGGGTVLLLAICYEQIGKTASAWVKYNEAVALARRDGRTDREERARERVDALEPRLSRLVLLVSPELKRAAGVEVSVDGTPVPIASVATLPVDPGPHTVVASAPGKQSWSATVSISDAEQGRLEVPPLSDLPAPPRPTRAPAAAPTRSAPAQAPVSSTRLAAWIVGAAGAVSLGVSGYFGWRAATLHDRARQLCPKSECDDATGVARNQAALRAARAADILGGIGVVAVGTAVTLYLSSGGSERAPRAELSITPTDGGTACSARAWF